MSDELDEHLRDESWRRTCPDITDGEIDALEALPQSHGAHLRSVSMLAAYRAGRVAGRPGDAGLSMDQYVPVRLPDTTLVVGKVKLLPGHDGAIVVQARPDGTPIPMDEPPATVSPVRVELRGRTTYLRTDQIRPLPDREGHHRDCTWLGPVTGWRCIRGCARLLEGP